MVWIDSDVVIRMTMGVVVVEADGNGVVAWSGGVVGVAISSSLLSDRLEGVTRVVTVSSVSSVKAIKGLEAGPTLIPAASCPSDCRTRTVFQLMMAFKKKQSGTKSSRVSWSTARYCCW